MKHQPYLCTLDAVRLHQSLDDSVAAENTTEVNNQLTFLIEEASRFWCEQAHRCPVPYYDTRSFDAPYDLRDRELMLDADLLEIDTLTNVDAISSSDYVLDSRNAYPKYAVVLTRGGTRSYWTYSSTPENAISIAGWWGYVPHYDTCFVDTGQDTTTFTSSATSLVLTGTGLGFEVFQYLKMDDELILVTAVAEDSNTTLTLERGVQGTTAAAHNATDIFRYKPVADITGQVNEMVRTWYKQLRTSGAEIQLFDGAVINSNPVDPRIMKGIRSHRRYMEF